MDPTIEGELPVLNYLYFGKIINLTYYVYYSKENFQLVCVIKYFAYLSKVKIKYIKI